jgi:hypothetical protein
MAKGIDDSGDQRRLGAYDRESRIHGFRYGQVRAWRSISRWQTGRDPRDSWIAW